MIYASRGRKSGFFDPEDLEFLTAISVYAALALDRTSEHLQAATALKLKSERLNLLQGELLRHQIPNGDVEQVLDRALGLLVDELKRKKFGATKTKRKPKRNKQPEARRQSKLSVKTTARRPRSRHIPNELKRQVTQRDGSRCTFTSPQGCRCAAIGMLEFHHLRPFGRGGEHDVDIPGV